MTTGCTWVYVLLVDCKHAHFVLGRQQATRANRTHLQHGRIWRSSRRRFWRPQRNKNPPQQKLPHTQIPQTSDQTFRKYYRRRFKLQRLVRKSWHFRYLNLNLFKHYFFLSFCHIPWLGVFGQANSSRPEIRLGIRWSDLWSLSILA